MTIPLLSLLVLLDLVVPKQAGPTAFEPDFGGPWRSSRSLAGGWIVSRGPLRRIATRVGFEVVSGIEVVLAAFSNFSRARVPTANVADRVNLA